MEIVWSLKKPDIISDIQLTVDAFDWEVPKIACGNSVRYLGRLFKITLFFPLPV